MKLFQLLLFSEHVVRCCADASKSCELDLCSTDKDPRNVCIDVGNNAHECICNGEGFEGSADGRSCLAPLCSNNECSSDLTFGGSRTNYCVPYQLFTGLVTNLFYFSSILV